MIPMCLRLDIRGGDRPRGVRLFLPLILVWIVVFALLAAALPFVFVASLVTIRGGTGIRILRFTLALVAVVFCLSGFRVDIASHRSGNVLISFD
jgi:hypothetical protein